MLVDACQYLLMLVNACRYLSMLVLMLIDFFNACRCLLILVDTVDTCRCLSILVDTCRYLLMLVDYCLILCFLLFVGACQCLYMLVQMFMLVHAWHCFPCLSNKLLIFSKVSYKDLPAYHCKKQHKATREQPPTKFWDLHSNPIEAFQT